MTFISPDDFKYYTQEKYHLRLSEFSEIGSQAVVTNVAVSLYSYVQDMDRLIQDALEDNTRTHQESRLHCPVGSGYRSVSNHLVVLLAIQNGISSFWEGWTWWRRVSEAAQHICYVPEKEAKNINPINHLFLVKPLIKDGDVHTW